MPHYSCLRSLFTAERWENECAYTQFVIEPEPGIKVLLTSYGVEHSLVHFPKGKVRLYVGNVTSECDVANIPEIKALAATGTIPLITVDPRGLGQSEAGSCNTTGFFSPYGSDYLYASAGDMLNENYAGRRVFDLLAVMDLLLEQGVTELELIGRGIGAITVAFAGLLHDSKPQVKLINYLPSYQLLIEVQRYKWPLSVMPRAILETCDLPDIYAALGERITKCSPWNAMLE